MSRMFYGSIAVSKIDKTKLFVGKKETYCNVTIWINDEVDQFGNILSITEGQSKEDREAKATKNYLGNLKEHVSGQAETTPAPVSTPAPSNLEDDTSELPF